MVSPVGGLLFSAANIGNMVLEMDASTQPSAKLDPTNGVREMLQSCDDLRHVHSHHTSPALRGHASRTGPHYKCSSCRAASNRAC